MKNPLKKIVRALEIVFAFIVYIIMNLTESQKAVARSSFILAGIISMTFLSVYQFAFQDLVNQQVGGSGIGQLFLGNFAVWLFSIFFTFMLLRQIKKRRYPDQ